MSIIMVEEEDDEQVQQLRHIFRRFDMDSDGSLTLLEVAALLRSLGLKPSADKMYSLLADLDANGNGAIEFDELLAAILPASADDEDAKAVGNQAHLLEVFKMFDRDGNGVITPAELAKATAKMGAPLSYRELSEFIREADADGDGVISFNEFAGIMARSAVSSLRLPAFLL